LGRLTSFLSTGSVILNLDFLIPGPRYIYSMMTFSKGIDRKKNMEKEEVRKRSHLIMTFPLLNTGLDLT
jgi:hypothetical protein